MARLKKVPVRGNIKQFYYFYGMYRQKVAVPPLPLVQMNIKMHLIIQNIFSKFHSNFYPFSSFENYAICGVSCTSPFFWAKILLMNSFLREGSSVLLTSPTMPALQGTIHLLFRSRPPESADLFCLHNRLTLSMTACNILLKNNSSSAYFCKNFFKRTNLRRSERGPFIFCS